MGGLEWINTLFAFRKTLLGPTYGSPLEKIQILPRTSSADPQQHYLVYITKDKVWSPPLQSWWPLGIWNFLEDEITTCRPVLPES